MLTYTGNTVSAGQQAVRAVACVAARCIFTFTTVTDPWILLTFVHVRAASAV